MNELLTEPSFAPESYPLMSKAAAEMTGMCTEVWSHQKVSSINSGPHSLCLSCSYLLCWKWVSIAPPFPLAHSATDSYAKYCPHHLHLPPAFDITGSIQCMQMPRASWNQFKEYFMSSNCAQHMSWDTGSWGSKGQKMLGYHKWFPSAVGCSWS